MAQALEVLHLEDDARDAELVQLALRSAGLNCTITRARTEEDFKAGLGAQRLDVILSDFSMPRFDGMAALGLAREHRPEVPFIFLSGTIGEERAVLALKRGATDYILKDRMGRLPTAIERALSEAREVERRRQAEENARTSAERLAHLLAHSPAVLYSLAVEGDTATPVFVSENVVGLLGFKVGECLAAEWWRDHVHPEDREIAFAVLKALVAHGASSMEYRLRHQDGRYLWIQDDVLLIREDGSSSGKAVGAWTDITERKRTQAELIQASRVAGKAEVATEILHDVRNVLTSINLSSSLLRSKVKGFSIEGVQKVSNLLSEQTELRGFLTEHEKGKQVPEFLRALAGRLKQEREAMTVELERLMKGVEHVHQLISVQQAYAKVCGARERVRIEEILEESLSLNGAKWTRAAWRIEKEFGAVPAVNLERHKLLQILVNLVRNAKQACEPITTSEKVLTLSLSCDEQWIYVSVRDNGVGIPPENLKRLFEHGFTTKKDGHGFGLRSAAAAAKELGGTLKAESDGANRGAKFTLTLPLGQEGGPG